MLYSCTVLIRCIVVAASGMIYIVFWFSFADVAITPHGDPAMVVRLLNHGSYMTLTYHQGVLGCLVQSFLCWRIKTLISSWAISIPLFLMALGSLGESLRAPIDCYS